MEKMRSKYVPPFIEVIEVEVEVGFAASASAVISAQTNDFTTTSFGEGGGGRSLFNN